MSTPLDPVYCPICRKQISADAATCPECGAKTSALERAEEAAERARQEEIQRVALQAQADAERRAQREADREARREAKDQAEEARKKALYEHATGHGICPHCKSPNVKPYTFTEGGSGTGQSMACCLGCALNPLAWLLIPLLQGKKRRGFECQYCSNRWSL